MKVYESAEGRGLAGIFVIAWRGTEGQASLTPHPYGVPHPRGHGRKAVRVGVDVVLAPAPHVGTIAQR